MQSLESIQQSAKLTPRVLISTGVMSIPSATSNVASRLRQHRVEMASDQQGKSVLARQAGAFTTAHDDVAVREEFGFAGHVIYLMTAKERITDTVDGWLEIDGGFFDSVS